MTSQTLGPDTISSWHQAFDYPLATTRAIERQLREDASSNRQRLRTLVGASYRDLLSTAERIIHLDERLRDTDAVLANLSRNCNPDIVDRKVHDVAYSQEQTSNKRLAGRAFAAQITLLRRCHAAIAKLLRQHGSILWAAKTLALSRLLYQSLSQSRTGSPLLASLREQLTTLRGHILRRIDQGLISPKSTPKDLVEAICAFCLATSSSSSDAMRHFHHLRLQSIQDQMGVEKKGRESILQAFRYYIQSLQSTKALLGRQLSDALKVMRNQPIINDHAILGLEELGLDTLQGWIPIEIRNFVPFIKHTDSTQSETESLTKRWSREVFEKYTEALTEHVRNTSNVSTVMGLRKDILEVWLPLYTSTPSHSSSEILEELRNIFGSQIKGLIHREAGLLADIGLDIENSIKDQTPTQSDQSRSLWNEDFVTMPPGKGGQLLKHELINRYLGTSGTIAGFLHSLGSWITPVQATRAAVQQLRNDRWQVLVEEDEDDDEAGAPIAARLQKDDPNEWIEAQDLSVRDAICRFQQQLQGMAKTLCKKGQNSQDHVLFLLRMIRESGRRISSAFAEVDLATLANIVPDLHHLLANIVLEQLPFPQAKPYHKRYFADLYLWGGSPPIPIQPSSRAFKLLRNLCNTMAELGTDLWTPAAVDAVKGVMQAAIVSGRLIDLASAQNPPEETAALDGASATNGTVSDVDWDATAKLQDLYDCSYLQRALSPKSEPSFVLEDTLQSLRAQLATGEREAQVRAVEQKAGEYWIRTSLLFGLLS